METSSELLDLGARVQVVGTGDEPGGTFAVYRTTGAGGQGVLYALVAPDGRLAALKVPSSRGLIPAEIERRILEKLPPHRNIVKLVGTATIQNVECSVLSWSHTNPFLRLNHPTLAHATEPFRSPGAKRTALPAMTCIEIIHEVLAALEHIHQNGYVHGDIKASNVLVEISSPLLYLPNADYFAAIQQRLYRTRLIDFGTARSRSYLANMTSQDFNVVPPEFTPLYAPPEVMRSVGTSRGGPEVDVYQIGLLLYELVTGHYPYDHVDPELARGGFSSLLIDVKRAEHQGIRRPYEKGRIRDAAQHDVVFAETFAAQRLRDRFYDEVEAIIDQATHWDPQKRPSIAALRARLIRSFELEAPDKQPTDKRPTVAMTNPRWHLVRANRLGEASRVPDPPELLEVNAIPRGIGRGPEPPPPEPSTVPRPDPKGMRVALVDDDKVTLTILAGTLRRRGYRVRTFQDPEQALDVLSRDHPDVAICDMQMPAMTGLELVKRLEERAKSRPFPVMILSSEGDEKTLSEAYHHGVTDYLVKPVGEAELVVKLEQAAARKRQSLPEAIPRELGGYELLDEVRRGEVAVVFRASRAQAAEDTGAPIVAVKVLRPEVCGETEPVLKLRREIDVLAACDHPKVPRLLASGLVGRLLYHVTGDVVPETLGEHVRQKGRLAAGETVTLVREIADALRHLHSRRIVHGDITPETIGTNESGQNVIADLTKAVWLGSPPRDDEAVPSPSRYTAPELQDTGRRPDPRSDLYALGVCALEALTGKPGAALDDPKTAALVPPALAAILVRLIARAPEARFQDGGSLLTALAQLPPA